MNFGTRRSDEVPAARGAVVSAGLRTWAGGVGVDRTAVLVRVVDGLGRAVPVAVEDEGLGVVELMAAVGVGAVDRSEAGEVDGTVAPTLAAPPAPAAHAEAATTNARANAPARERAAYRPGCLTRSHASEPTKAPGSTLGMMAW